MTDIIKTCKIHGELISNKVTTNNRCLACAREYASTYRKKYPEKIKANNDKRNALIKEFKLHGLEYKPIRKNNRYTEKRTSIECKKHGEVTGQDLIVRENDYLRCRLCAYERNRSWEKRNQDKVKKTKRNTYLRYISRYQEEAIMRAHKITTQQHTELMNKQNSTCAICKGFETRLRTDGTRSPLAIDHCHKTGKIRGLLCKNCNTGIGMFKEDINKLFSAVEYIKTHQEDDYGGKGS